MQLVFYLKGKIVAQVSPDGTKIQFSAKTNDSFNISNVTGGTTLSKLGYTPPALILINQLMIQFLIFLEELKKLPQPFLFRMEQALL